MSTLTIGQVAQRVGVGIETIRYYEREGIIPEPERSRSGYRQFSVETVDRLRFVRHAKRLGFSLKEIRELLALRIDSPTAPVCDEVRQHAERKRRDM